MVTVWQMCSDHQQDEAATRNVSVNLRLLGPVLQGGLVKVSNRIHIITCIQHKTFGSCFLALDFSHPPLLATLNIHAETWIQKSVYSSAKQLDLKTCVRFLQCC